MSQVAAAGAFAVAAYVPEYRYGGMNWTHAAAHTTHLIFFSLEISPTGFPSALDRLPSEAILPEIRAAAAAHGTKLQLCFGGNARTAAFPTVTTSKRKRAVFVEKTVALVARLGFHGVDLNWEYPTSQREWQAAPRGPPTDALSHAAVPPPYTPSPTPHPHAGLSCFSMSEPAQERPSGTPMSAVIEPLSI